VYALWLPATALKGAIINELPSTGQCMRFSRPVGSQPELMGLLGPPVRGPILKFNVNRLVLLLIQHLYRSVRWQILNP